MLVTKPRFNAANSICVPSSWIPVCTGMTALLAAFLFRKNLAKVIWKEKHSSKPLQGCSHYFIKSIFLVAL